MAWPRLPAAEITASDIVEILDPIWFKKNETARRLRGRVETVFDHAADVTDLSYRNPAAMTGQLRKKLPKLNKRTRHYAALPFVEIGGFVAELRQRERLQREHSNSSSSR
jgi:hypothetical protein